MSDDTIKYFCEEPECIKRAGFKRQQDLDRHTKLAHKRISTEESLSLDTDLMVVAVQLEAHHFKDQGDGMWIGPLIKLPGGYSYRGMLDKPIFLARGSTAMPILIGRDDK